MVNTFTAKSPISKEVKMVDVVKESVAIKAFDQEVKKFLRSKFTIKTSNYYHYAGDVPWVAISKNIQNQMVEKSINRVIYDWNNPGYDHIDIYPQGDTAFAVAMHSKSSSSKIKLVGYFVLTANKE